MDDLITTIVQALAFLAGATGVAGVVLRFSASGRALVQRTIGGQELWFGFAAALLMTLASLYLSEVRHFLPCRFCWFQRIFAYPNVIVLGWAAFRRDVKAWAPALTLAGIGLAFSTYHILIDTGVVSESSSCDPLNPCTVRWAWADHWYSTIQVGAFCCFLFIIGLGLHALAKPSESPAEA